MQDDERKHYHKNNGQVHALRGVEAAEDTGRKTTSPQDRSALVRDWQLHDLATACEAAIDALDILVDREDLDDHEWRAVVDAAEALAAAAVWLREEREAEARS